MEWDCGTKNGTENGNWTTEWIGVENGIWNGMGYNRDVRPWLDLVDELRAHGISQDLPLPQIAVMGDQSCGKSSVLEV